MKLTGKAKTAVNRKTDERLLKRGGWILPVRLTPKAVQDMTLIARYYGLKSNAEAIRLALDHKGNRLRQLMSSAGAGRKP